MINDTDLTQCIFTTIGNHCVLKTPSVTIDCHLIVPPELIDSVEARELTSSEVQLVKYIRDVEGYRNLNEKHRYLTDFTIGDIVAISVSRNSGTSVKNLTDDGIVIPFWLKLLQYPSNYIRDVRIGGTYDMITDYGLAKVLIIERVTEPEFSTQYHHVKVMLINDSVYPVPGKPYPITQFSIAIVPSFLLINEEHYFAQ
jgi:hypothetical protein